jgi:hypothetical protein
MLRTVRINFQARAKYKQGGAGHQGAITRDGDGHEHQPRH